MPDRDAIAEALHATFGEGVEAWAALDEDAKEMFRESADAVAPFLDEAALRGRVAEREHIRAGIEGLRENLANATDRAIYRDGVLVEALALIDAKTNFWGPDGEDTGSP